MCMMRCRIILSLWIGAYSVTAVAAVVTKGGGVSLKAFSQRYVLQSASASNLQIVPDPVNQGRSVFMLQLRANDRKVFSGHRTEIVASREYVRQGLRWYALSFLLPNDWIAHSYPIVLAQLHTSQKKAVLPPPVSVVVEGERLKLELRSSSAPVVGPYAVTKQTADTKVLGLGGLERGRWHCFVFRADWSWTEGRGELDVWHNRERVYSARNAANSYSTWLGNYPKVGLYAPGAMGVGYRYSYADFIWIGDEASTFDEMAALTPCAI